MTWVYHDNKYFGLFDEGGHKVDWVWLYVMYDTYGPGPSDSDNGWYWELTA